MPISSQAETEMLADPLQFLKSHPSEILNIRSKEEALQVFLQSNPSLISQLGTRPSGKDMPVKVQIPLDVQEAITQIMAGLVALQAAQDTGAIGPEPHSGHHSESPNSFHLMENHEYQWMADIPIHEKLTTLKVLKNALSSLQSTPTTSMEVSDQQYRQFEQYFDTLFPTSAEDSTSWTNLLKERGIQGIQTRLEEFQPTLGASTDKQQPRDADITRFHNHFIRARLIPHFQAHFAYELLELQAQVFKILLTQRPVITRWQEQEQKRTTLARLCGSWLWTLHNHQNHQDHKMTVYFLPPGEPIPPNQPIPNSIVLRGDTVHVEWVFPQGKQEDSLLLSNRDSMMEGTFKNTLGPYGSITGKRLSTCKPS
ncbi:MAG: hypothetical protein AB7T38_17065 [Nitrospirales bacterium]